MVHKFYSLDHQLTMVVALQQPISSQFHQKAFRSPPPLLYHVIIAQCIHIEINKRTCVFYSEGLNVEWYEQDKELLEKNLQVNINKGLTEQQANMRRKQYGSNRIKEKAKQSIWVLFMKQFQDFMVIVLLAATLIAGMLGEYIDAVVIIIIVLLNGCIGFFQEFKAENSLEKLIQLSTPVIRVLRNDEPQTISAEKVVVGDIVTIRSGERVAADLRLISVNAIETEESALTNE